MRTLLLIPCLLVACSGASETDSTPATDSGAADAVVADTGTTLPTDSGATDTAKPSDAATDATSEEDTFTPTDSGGTFCGGIAGTMCPSGYYCFQGTGKCMTPDAGGTCAKIPMGCTKELNWVCGCDGKSYTNPCMAAAAGVNVASTGECASASACGAATCAKNEYCDFTNEFACAGEGSCKPRPELCTGLYDPVCGCNNRTYSNPCMARNAGVDVASMGMCPP